MNRLLALLLFASPVVVMAAPTIHMRARATVENAVVRLGDVATLNGFSPEARKRAAAIELSPSPAPGLGKLLPRAYLRGRIKDGGVPSNTRLRLPNRLELTRKVERVLGTALQTRIERTLRAKMPHAPEDVAAVKVPRPTDLRIPVGGTIEIEFVHGERFDGQVPVTVTLRDDAKMLRRLRVNATVDLFVEALAVETPVGAGEALPEIVRVRVPKSKLPRDALRSVADLAGATARRGLKVGEPLRRAMLKIPPLVKRGESVRMVVIRGALRLSATGEALQTGRRGDTVRVRNLNSRKVVMGRVTGPQTVMMEF